MPEKIEGQLCVIQEVLQRHHSDMVKKQNGKKWTSAYQVCYVKTRWEGTKSKKHYLTKHSMKAYEEAIKLDIPAKLVIVTFYNNFDIKVEDVDFHKKYFKIY